ncbi:hypothetical protein FOPG_19927 [Fusarium oxysporum f. sp. conglutinans race 2 54008]|uniref:Uncharacterized protein n=2 Tax=Fusarium oxysporum TaxID=5507 RepID=A0A0J9UWM3_FUSO4|nr:hypothetical protein FOXG_05569 [Fusarium oxysporum f. sp. lycopersici 4287]EXL63800.1 hypothetical protein FOPG_19927 [Fusarium oxysporum f. sp. conglutinans race 2 54008]KNB02951.1 hypothetical protein FOXG_05569 [Fusarium oxysporum f. sp. lycopersici 4287]
MLTSSSTRRTTKPSMGHVPLTSSSAELSWTMGARRLGQSRRARTTIITPYSGSISSASSVYRVGRFAGLATSLTISQYPFATGVPRMSQSMHRVSTLT